MSVDILFIILKIISFSLTLGICIWAWRTFGNKRARTFFCGMLGFFFLSTILFATDGLLDTWLKHVLFYIGQFLFYLFLVAIIANHDKEASQSFSTTAPHDPYAGKGSMMVAGGVMTGMANSGIGDWVDFITDQGMQHMLTLPLLLLIITTVEIRYVFVTSKGFRSALNTFMFAATALMMIHLMEFIVESQKLIPLLDGDPNEILEFGWYYLGLFFFARGIYKMKKASAERAAPTQTVHNAL